MVAMAFYGVQDMFFRKKAEKDLLYSKYGAY